MVYVQYGIISRITVLLWQCCLFLPVGTNTVAPTEAAGPEKNQTDQMTAQPTIPPSGTQASASPTPLTSTTTTTTSPTSANPTTAVDDSTTTTPPTNTSHPAEIPLPDSTAPSNTSSTTVATPEPPKSETTASTTTTALVTQPTSTSSTSSTQGPLNTESHTETLTSLRPEEHPETSTVARQKTTVLPSSSTSAQAKPHADPSQLNDSKCIILSSCVGVWAGRFTAWILTEPGVNRLDNKGDAVLCFPAQASPHGYTHTHKHTYTNTHHMRPPPVCIFYKHCHHQALHNHGSVWERDRGSHGTRGLKNALFSFSCCFSLTLSLSLYTLNDLCIHVFLYLKTQVFNIDRTFSPESQKKKRRKLIGPAWIRSKI